MPVEKYALDKARGAILLKNLKKDDELVFWFVPESKAGPPILLVEKDESRIKPKVQREKANAKAKDKIFEGTVTRDEKGRLVFDGEGGSPLKKVKEGIKELAEKDKDWKASKSAMLKPVISSNGVKEEDPEDAEESGKKEAPDKARKEWIELSGAVQGLYLQAKGTLGEESKAFKSLKTLKDRAFSLKKKGALEDAVKTLRELEASIKKITSTTSDTISEEDWKAIQEMSKEAYTTASRILPKDHRDWGEIDKLRVQAVEAKRQGDLTKSVGFFRTLIDKAQGIVNPTRKGKSVEDAWKEAMSLARSAFEELDKVSGQGDPVYDLIEKKQRTAVELKKRDDLTSSARLFTEIAENIKKYVKDLGDIDPELAKRDWDELAAAFKLARRRKKHSWFWFCREGADGLPVLFIERKEETMRVRGKAALRTAKKKKNLSGWITRGVDGALTFYGEGAVPLTQAEKDFRTKLATVDELSSIGPQLRAVVFKDASEGGDRPVDVDGPDELLEEVVSFVNLQKARLEWDGARKSLESQLGKVKTQILSKFPGEKATVSSLDVVMRQYDSKLIDQLDKALNAEGETRGKHYADALTTVNLYKDTLDDDDLLTHLDKNRWVDVEMVKTVSTALGKIQSQLGA